MDSSQVRFFLSAYPNLRRRLLARKANAAVQVFIFFGISLFSASHAYAQVSGATLSGTVSDSSGAVIPKAQISIKNVATDVLRTTETSTAGFYTAPDLSPGKYAVSVTAAGFNTAVRSNIALTVGAQQVLDFTMQVGQVSQTVEVTEEAPTVELTSSELGATENSTTVREL